jgi:hypothetical protein
MANWLNLVLEMFCINVAARLIVDITSNNLTKNFSVQILYMELCLRCSEPNDWMQNNQEGALYSPTVGMLTNIWCVSFVSIQKRKRFRSRKLKITRGIAQRSRKVIMIIQEITKEDPKGVDDIYLSSLKFWGYFTPCNAPFRSDFFGGWFEE